MKVSLEKNVWAKTDEMQWIKYMDNSTGTKHWFKVVDYMVDLYGEKPQCTFRAMSILVKEDDLYNGTLEKYIDGYYENIEEVLSEYGDCALQTIAECIAETDMFSGQADNYEDIFVFDIDTNLGKIENQIYAKCDYVDKYIKEHL